MDEILHIAQRARAVSHSLANLSTAEKNQALLTMAAMLVEQQENILAANAQDMQLAQGLSHSMLDRLRLTPERVQAMQQSILTIGQLPDPVGTVLEVIERPNGLRIERISIPIGVLVVIYESRPNVTADAAALSLKSGNALILRGGKESFYSTQAIVQALQAGLLRSQLPVDAIQMLATTDRSAVDLLLQMDQYIDVIIPRGGKQLIESIASKTRIPLFKHAAGVCHTYLHSDADLDMSINVVLNAKMRRPGICGATETLLIDQAIAKPFLPAIVQALTKVGCEVRGCPRSIILHSSVKTASEEDYGTEYLDAIIATKIVDDLDAAIAHILQYGTQHTEAIITANQTAAAKFIREVDSAIVMHNTSTQFADGGEFGMGAEIGIATGKLHARGPVGVKQLTTFKYIVRGNGQTRP
jgi:glutamate-5-semialdehyde dehydrogenase